MHLCISRLHPPSFPVFFTYPAPPSLYTLSLHDALPISHPHCRSGVLVRGGPVGAAALLLPHVAGRRRRDRCPDGGVPADLDRKSTRLNSSHVSISYAVFCLKKKNTQRTQSYSCIYHY